MSVLDKSVPYYPVVMILKHKDLSITAHMAEGYRFIPFDETYRDPWINLHVTLGQLASYEEGRRYFDETFTPDMDAVKKQFLIVVDSLENLVGTSSVWEGYHFGKQRYRVHWVGVDPAHQQKGIAKALMMETIRLYDTMGQEEPLYLTTQTNSYIAIQMYLRLGFVAYKGEMPVNFHATKETFQEDNEKAWNIIMNKIDELTKGMNRK